jgi:hypothetical protein
LIISGFGIGRWLIHDSDLSSGGWWLTPSCSIESGRRGPAA